MFETGTTREKKTCIKNVQFLLCRVAFHSMLFHQLFFFFSLTHSAQLLNFSAAPTETSFSAALISNACK